MFFYSLLTTCSVSEIWELLTQDLCMNEYVVFTYFTREVSTRIIPLIHCMVTGQSYRRFLHQCVCSFEADYRIWRTSAVGPTFRTFTGTWTSGVRLWKLIWWWWVRTVSGQWPALLISGDEAFRNNWEKWTLLLLTEAHWVTNYSACCVSGFCPNTNWTWDDQPLSPVMNHQARHGEYRHT